MRQVTVVFIFLLLLQLLPAVPAGAVRTAPVPVPLLVAGRSSGGQLSQTAGSRRGNRLAGWFRRLGEGAYRLFHRMRGERPRIGLASQIILSLLFIGGASLVGLGLTYVITELFLFGFGTLASLGLLFPVWCGILPADFFVTRAIVRRGKRYGERRD